MNKTKNLFLKLLILLTFGVGWSGSAWAQAVSQLPLTSGVYEIQNISNEGGSGTGRGYLINYTNHSSGLGLAECTWSSYTSKHPNNRNNGTTTCGYWYLHAHEDGSYTLVSISTLGGNDTPRFVQVGGNGGKSTLVNTENYLTLTTSTKNEYVRDNKRAVLIANKTATNVYLSGGCGTDSNQGSVMATDNGNDGGCPWLFIPVAESSLSAEQKAIRAKYLERFALLKDGVTINFQDKDGNAITGETVVYTPTSGSAVNLTSSTGTYNFGDVLYSPSLFSAADFAKILSVAYNETGKTLTFTITQNQWYYIKVNNGGGYMSSAYVNGSGDLLLNNTSKPTDYKGLWMEIPVTNVDANGNATIYFINAYDGDTKILAMTGAAGSGDASARMYNLNEVPSNAVKYFVRQYKDSNPNAFYYKTGGNNYLNYRNPKLAYWDNASAYGNNGSTFDHTAVPNLPNNAKIQFEAASPSVTLPSGLNIIYRNLEFYRMSGVEIQHYQSAPGIITELQNGSTYHFGNVPGLTSLFTVYNNPELRVTGVEVDGTTVKLIIGRLPAIIHRQHATFNHLSEVDEEHKPNSKFIQEGKGLIDHPNAANFAGAGYTDNDRRIQNTSVFHLTQYTTKGGTTQVRMPFRRERDGSTQNYLYQRWYDFTTERCLEPGIIDLSGFDMYYNGQAKTSGPLGLATIKLPANQDEITVGVDASEFEDPNPRKDSEGNLYEPSLSMRVLIHVKDAAQMANALTTSGDTWWEEKTYIVPNIKNGEDGHRNNIDLLPLDMPFTNYWVYDNTNTLRRIVEEGGNYNTLAQNLVVVVEGDAASYITADIFKSNVGIGDPAPVAANHFLYYKVNGSNRTRVVPAGSQAIIKVYARYGTSGTQYQLAKFTLNFQADAEPLAITSVVGNTASTRSVDYFKEQGMAEVASLTFKQEVTDFKKISNRNPETYTYAFPIDPTQTSYSYSPSNAFAGYRITKKGYGMKTLPVSIYENNIKNKDKSDLLYDVTFNDNRYTDKIEKLNDYYLYVDAAETPGQVATISLDGNLCPGTRLFFYGWLNSQNPYVSGSTSASVILELIGKKGGQEKVLASYLPGVISDAAYDSEGGLVRSVVNGHTASDGPAYSFSYTTNTYKPTQYYLAAWQSIGFSYLLTESGFDSFELRVINNCFSTAGGDYSLDDFRVFVNPPKGNVDFTTPLCSDKVRHAKIHAEYDMLKNISGVNENSGADMYVTCCFLEASVFDENTKINDESIFVVDDQGNHNLKDKYSTGDNLTTAKALINAAFGKALVGTRELSAGDKANHGFHVYAVSQDYKSIEEYAYHNSLVDKVYREEVGGIRRIVFKEDVVRGEQELLTDGRWPHMRPSTTYYLVFSPIKATKGDGTSVDIDHHSAATDIFRIHESCSFLGKFTTKDPMHVILDNADIEADLPIKAVCHGESTAFQFNMPTLKLNKPIVDEAYCISDQNLNGKMVPESQGTHRYKYEPILNGEEVKGVITNLPYDWWLGGTLNGTTYRGTIEAYNNATHPTRTYSGPKDIAHKQDNAPVKIAQAMTDFRFFYPDFGKEGNTDWSTVVMKPYNPETGYGLLNSEIETIKDFVNAGIILLHRDTYNMPLTYEEAEELQLKELNDMMEKEMNDNILELALKLNSEQAIADKKPLKAIEGTVLGMLSAEGRKGLTFEEYASLTYEQLQGLADKLSGVDRTLPENELHKAVEAVLKAMTESDLHDFAKNNFPDIGHEKRAYLVIRALNILSKETVAKLPAADQQNTTKVREALRAQMINVFKEQDADVLRKMWSDTSAELTEEERAALLKDDAHPDTPKNPASMGAADLAVLLEDALAKITDNVIADMSSDRYVHLTLVPIMPSQKNFVDEKYIFCPEPRGVKLRITSHEPRMIDGFADMPYPEDMTNVPVRIGLQQIKESKANAAKTLRIPVRGLKKAAKDGVKAVKLDERTGYYTDIFLKETDDTQYQQTENVGVLSEAKNVNGIYSRIVGTIEKMVATYPTAEDKTPDNYLVVKFKDDMNFREGYTYRVGINFMEHDSEGEETISCPGTMLFDMKIVPEYQKWTASVNTDWTNDGNWARADRTELNADNDATGDVIEGSTDITIVANYPTNASNKTSKSFVPMYFTNVLFDKNTDADKIASLYTEKETSEGKDLTPASRSEKKFLEGLHSTATAAAVYDMEVYKSDGTWHAGGNYECGLFGTYIANGITFKPGSQLINAHYLNYKKAWVEYELATGRWYTLASPLQNTFAGEWYSPTDGGKQMTPHFYDINYKTDLNDRFRPAYYQRSWDSQGNNPVYLKTANSDNETEQNAYIMADWSYVYNDVTKEYSNGGFSVMVDDSHMTSSSDGSVINRMPKADTQYTYYDINGNTGQHNPDALGVTAKRNRLWSDELNSTTGTFQHTITNATDGNNFFLVANPFMANMDMDKFFDVNDQFEKKYWIMTSDGQEVSVKVDGSQWVGTSTDKNVAPLQGFFVKGPANTKSITVTYNAEMQKTASATAELKARSEAASSIETLAMTVQRDDFTSTAVVALSSKASKEYVASEDCETFIDSNIADKPTIYTVASGQAMTVNTVSAFDMIAVGIVGKATEEVDVTFSGSTETLYLYDSESGEYTEIQDGTTLSLSCGASGRYFITVSPTALNEITDDDFTRKGVWSLQGRFLGDSIKGLTPGVYIVDGVKMNIR